MGFLTALSHFVARMGERELPLYKLLKSLIPSDGWTTLEPGETLLLYITATTQVISTALVVEREEPGHVYKIR
jgi:hypothetical protein